MVKERKRIKSICKLPDGYGIGSDSFSTTLYKEYKSEKTGKIVQKIVGYYINVSQAFDRIIDLELSAGNVDSINDLEHINNKIKELKKWCKEMLDEKWQIETYPNKKYEKLMAHPGKQLVKKSDRKTLKNYTK